MGVQITPAGIGAAAAALAAGGGGVLLVGADGESVGDAMVEAAEDNGRLLRILIEGLQLKGVAAEIQEPQGLIP